jgi:hypothetical protein
MSKIRTAILVVLLALPWRAGQGQQAPLPSNPHGPLKAGMDCSDCHTGADWKTLRPDPKFDHSRETRFALTGQHATVTCASCHLDLRFDEPKVEPTDCASCHADVHRGNLGQNCTSCHNTNDFRDVESLSLHQRTAFPLTGAHVTTPCEACHKTERAGVFAAVPRDCVACHQSALDQAAASGVDHAGFPRDCTQCHVTLAWSGGTAFDHVAASGGYVLEGAHTVQRCASCHRQPGFTLAFSPAPTSNQDCVACHQTDYTSAHGGEGYPTTCTDCHNPNSWDADFDHAVVGRGFALQGAHTAQPCAACHVQPGNALRWAPAPAGNTDCVACHLPDWQREHAAQQFPQTCTSCHTQSNWSSTFNHDATEFRINSGAHRGQWASCATCHTTPGDYKAFTCLTCHAHNETAMADKHRERPGYSYDSQRCYSCHGR